MGKVRDKQRAKRNALAIKLRNIFWDAAGYPLNVREAWGEGNWMETGPKVNGHGGTPENCRRAWIRLALYIRKRERAAVQKERARVDRQRWVRP